MEGQLRRRAPRVNAKRRAGRYLVEDDLLSGWHRCLLLDVSFLGVGVELLGPESSSILGRRIVVEMDMGNSESVTLRLSGVVRNIRRGEFGGVRAGIEFTRFSDNEQSALKMMEHLDSRW